MSTKTKTFITTDSAWKGPGALEFRIFKDEAGYMLDSIFGRHQLVIGGDLDGSSVTVETMVPGQNVWRVHSSGLGATEVVEINDIIQGIKVKFVGGGGTPVPTITMTSRIKGL